MSGSDGLAAVQSRVAELRALIGISVTSVPLGGTTATTTSSTTSSTSSSDFATALQSALTDQSLGGGSDASSAIATLLGQNGSGTGDLASLLAAAVKKANAGAVGATNGVTGSTGAPATGSTAGPATGAGDVGSRAVALAASYSGVPYLWGGENPQVGVDCSGLTQTVYAQLGVKLPRVAQDQATVGTKVASLDDAKPGDLVFFGSPIHHVGIYVGNGKMIDAPRTGKTVGVHDLWGTPTAIRRVAPAGASGAAGAFETTAVGAASTDLPAAPAAGAGASPQVMQTVSGSGNSVDGPYAALFAAAGAKYGVDPALLSAVAKAESAYNPRAVSSAGAQGLMQLMPATARSLGVDPYQPSQAVDGAARLLAGLIRDFGGRTDLALAGYNAGPGAVRRYGGIPPYAETQQYVKRVTRYWEALR